MKKRFYYIFIQFSLIVLLSCSVPKIHIPGQYDGRYLYESHKESSLLLSDVAEAGDYAEEHPDDYIVTKEMSSKIVFNVNQNYTDTGYIRNLETNFKDKSSRSVKNKYTIYSSKVGGNTFDINTKKFDFSSFLSFYSDIMNTSATSNYLPDGEIFSTTTHSQKLMNIKDFVTYNYGIHYSSISKIRNINFVVDDKETVLEGEDIKSNSGYFKTDSRYKIFPLKLPIRGTKVEVDYDESYSDARFNGVHYINDEFFTKKKTLKIHKPDWLDIEIVEMNFGKLKFNKTESIEYPNKNSSKKEKFIVYTFYNVPKFPNLNFSRGISYNLPLIRVLYKSYKKPEKKDTKDSVKINLFNNSEGLYKWYKMLTQTLKNNTTPFDSFTKALVKDCKTDEEKIKKVFYWVQDNIRYVAFEDGIAGFRPDECDAVYNKRFGDCKGMANLTKNMLKVLGFDARLAWIGTKNLNFNYDKPGLESDNHMICALKFKNEFIFLDATESYVPFKMYANRIQGRQTIVEDGENHLVLKIPTHDIKFNEDYFIENIKINGDKLNINIKNINKGENKLQMFRNYNYLKTQNKEKVLYNYLNKGKINIKTSNIKTSDLNNRDIDLEFNYDLEVSDAIFNKNGKTYVNIEFDRDFLFALPDTMSKLDFEMDYIYFYNKTSTLTLDKNQKVINTPGNLNISTEFYDIKIEYIVNGNFITYKKYIQFKTDYIPNTGIAEFKNHIKELTKFYNTYLEIQ